MKARICHGARERSGVVSGKSGAGFTLLEFLIAFAIVVIIMASLATLFRDFFIANTNLGQSFLAQREAETLIDETIHEVREAASSDLGAYPLEIAEAASLAFYSNIDRDPSRERVHYFVDGTDLKKSVVEPAGQPLTYSTTTGATESLKTVLRDVVASQQLPMFSYRSGFSTSTPPATLPIDQIRLVIIRFTIDRDPGVLPPPFSIFGLGNLRNLKQY